MVGRLALVLVAGCAFHRGEATSDDAAAIIDTPTMRDWWNPAWRVRMPLTITNTASDELLVGYQVGLPFEDRKSTRLNSSHRCISYAVFCLKKKKNKKK